MDTISAIASSITSLVTGGASLSAEAAQVEQELTYAAYVVAAFMLIVVFELAAILMAVNRR